MRRATRALCATLVVCGLFSIAGPSAQATNVARVNDASATAFTGQDSESEGASLYRAVLTPTQLADVRFVLPDRGHMYVAAGDSVYDINDRGLIARTFAALPGALGLAVSSDGSTLYVAESAADKIAAITVETGAVSSEYAVASCPQHLAVIGSTLFYSAGCLSAGSIGHVDLTTGEVSTNSDLVLTRSDALIAATSDTLIAADGQLRSWQITTSEEGQPVFGSENTGSYFPHVLSLTTHAQTVVVIDSGVNAYGIYRADLGGLRSYETVSYPTAIAWSSDGSLIAGGSDTPKGNGLRLINANDGRVGVQASLPSLTGREGNQAVVPGALMFALDEQSIVALTQEWTSHGWAYSIARASTTRAAASTVTVHVTPPSVYGKPTRIAVTTPGRPHVRVLVTASGRSWHSSRVVTTNAQGVGLVDLVVPYSGTVTANLSGDFDHEAARPSTVRVRIPSSLTIAMARGTRVVNGVVHYAKLSDMRQRVLLSPKITSRMVKATLAYKSAGKWLTTKPFTLYTDANGYVNTAMKYARRSVPYRLTFSFSGDAWNTGIAKNSPAFMLG